MRVTLGKEASFGLAVLTLSLARWEILWTEESGGLQSMGSRRVDTTVAAHACTALLT